MKNIKIFGCPFDAASSYRSGSRSGPDAIRKATKDIEDYSPYLDCEFSDVSFSDCGNLKLPEDSRGMLRKIENKTKEILKSGDIPFALGGDHSVTTPVVRAVHGKHPDLKVIYIDGHCDLRDSYLGSKFSHASVARRILEMVGSDSIFHFGVRSGSREEFVLGRKEGIFKKFCRADFSEAVRKIGKSPVYITFDLDVFNPGIFGGTCVPEPGGIEFQDFVVFAKTFQKRLNIAGLDVVELSPKWDRSDASSFLAATVVRELLFII